VKIFILISTVYESSGLYSNLC